MNTKIISTLLLTAAAAEATVSPVGVDTIAGANWRTGATLEADAQYGTSGYVVFGLNATNGVYTPGFDISPANAANAYSLPAGISDVTTIDTNIGMWSGNGNFGQMQDPANGNALTAAPVLANSAGTRQFTINRITSEAWRLTLMTASGDGEGTLYNVAVDDGTGERTQTWDHLANGLVYHVFDITAGTDPISVTVTTTGQNRSLTGMAFDPVPVVIPPPAIVVPPAAATVVQGGPATFTVSAAGSGVTLQWQRNGGDIPGATSATYHFLTTAADHGAAYRCVATNGSGSATSDPATLTLTAPAPRTADYRTAINAEASRIAFFPFDGDIGLAVTNTGNALTGGTVNQGVLTGSPSLVVGTAALAGSASLSADPAWEFADDSTGTVEAFIHHTAATPHNPCIFSIRQTALNTRMSLHADAAGTKFYFWNGAAAAVWDAPVNTIGRRTHVAFVFDAGSVTAYADGVSLGTQAVPLGSGSGLPAQIGASDGGTAEAFAGSVDEVAIFSDALPAASIAAHASAWYGPLPEITVHPLSQTVVEGAPVTFSVSSIGPDLRYQWRRNTVVIPTATNSSLQVVTAAADNGVVYDCIVTNTAGSDTSDPATLILVAEAPRSAAYHAAITAEPGKLAYFPFDGDIGPAVTNTISATNGGTLRGTSSLAGAAAEVVGTTGLRGTAGLTADAEWEFPDGTGSVEAMLYQSGTAGANPCFFSIRDSASVRYSLHGATNGGALFFWNGSAVSQWTTPRNMIGRRSHVVITFDNGNVTAYFDGVPLGTRGNGLGGGTGISTQIGSATENSAELWPGTIDELALYADPLSPEVVNAHAGAWFGTVAQPVITQISISSGILFLTVPSATDLSYIIESSPDLVTPWTSIGTATTGTGSDLFLSAPAAASAEFFRVRAFR
jgi:hypothetical protein